MNNTCGFNYVVFAKHRSCIMLCISVQDWLNRTFKGIFAGKEGYLEEKLDMDSELLTKLEISGVIGSRHRTAIEVTSYLFQVLKLTVKL